MDPSFDRTQGIGASDALRIMNGAWHELWMEKTKRLAPADLSDNFAVQLGKHTEDLHLDWLARKNKWTIVRPATTFRFPEAGWLYCHLDGAIHHLAGPHVPIEVKHCHGRATVRERAVYYMPQLQHIMMVTGTMRMIFSVIAGNDEPQWIEVERSPAYIENLLDLERKFWWHVAENVEPIITPDPKAEKTKALTSQVRIGGLVSYDMRKNNHWPILAKRYVSTLELANQNAQALKDLKALVPDDAAEAGDDLVTIKRDKAGRLRVTVAGKEDNDVA